LRADGSEILCASEAEVYEQLDMDGIAPGIGEDHGEIISSRQHKLPHLITMEDLRADLHTHSTWSDGKVSIQKMVEAARERGLKVIAITDHTAGLGVTGGLKG